MTIDELLQRGVGEVIQKEALEKKLLSKKKLRVKLGIDPTGPDIHLGHTVPLRKLKAFQDMGHTAVFIVGDFTARIGDPSGLDKTRPKSLTAEEVRTNAAGYFSQAFKILDKEKTEVHMQSEWFDDFNLAKFLELARKISVAQLLEHETFKKRVEKQLPFTLLEMMYPILQGYDSVMVKADVELGGVDQKFNLLFGRQVQKIFGMPEQDIMTVNYLIGTDGKEKMSKSLGNYVAVNDSPGEIYGKIMSIPDGLIIPYYEMVTDVTDNGLEVIKRELKDGKNPRDVKAELAKLIVENFHSAEDAENARAEFDKVFSKGGKPSDIEGVKLTKNKYRADELLVETKLAESRSEAKRLIEQGGVMVSDIKISSPYDEISLGNGDTIQVGKRKYIKVQIGK